MLWDPRWQEKVDARRNLEPWQHALLDAADRIEKHGWVRCEWGNERRGYCVLGALRGAPQSLEAEYELNSYLGMPAHWWNDGPGRTKGEVLFALRDCARRGVGE
jgi:hypothetical protein